MTRYALRVMRHSDTIDKIVQVYLAGLCRERFMYQNTEYIPKVVIVSPLLLRGYTCPPHCGACCGNFSLDYLPTEATTEDAQLRTVELQGRHFAILSDLQRDVSDRWCRNLDRHTGRCQ